MEQKTGHASMPVVLLIFCAYRFQPGVVASVERIVSFGVLIALGLRMPLAQPLRNGARSHRSGRVTPTIR